MHQAFEDDPQGEGGAVVLGTGTTLTIRDSIIVGANVGKKVRRDYSSFFGQVILFLPVYMVDAPLLQSFHTVFDAIVLVGFLFLMYSSSTRGHYLQVELLSSREGLPHVAFLARHGTLKLNTSSFGPTEFALGYGYSS